MKLLGESQVLSELQWHAWMQSNGRRPISFSNI